MAQTNQHPPLPRAEVLALAKEQIKNLIDVQFLLNVLGFKISSTNRSEIRASCLIHGGDNPTSFRMRLETKRFVCYSHKCEGIPGQVENDVFDLVMKVKKVSFMEALRFLGDLVGINVDTMAFDEELLASLRRKKDIATHLYQVRMMKEGREKLPGLSEETLKEYISGRTSYFIDKGVPAHLLDFFEVGHMIDTKGIPRETIPIRDETGRLVSMSGRRTDNDEEPRYLLVSEFKKRRALYNIHNAIKVCSAFGSCIILVEGFKAAWAVHNSGFPNVAACMGSSLTEAQAQLAAENGFLRCVLMFDGDAAGKEGAIAGYFIARKYMKTNVVKLYELYPGMSPDDFSSEMLGDIITQHIRF